MALVDEDLGSVRSRFGALLDAASAQDPDGARALLLRRAAEALVPDEALVLVALAARPAALVEVQGMTRTGLASEPVLAHVSTVGRTAGVALPELTAHYVARLLETGLAEAGPADDRLEDDYRALLALPSTLAALARARAAEGITPRVVRRTLVLSGLGRLLVGG